MFCDAKHRSRSEITVATGSSEAVDPQVPLAVLVHQTIPIARLTLKQLDRSLATAHGAVG